MADSGRQGQGGALYDQVAAGHAAQAEDALAQVVVGVFAVDLGPEQRGELGTRTGAIEGQHRQQCGVVGRQGVFGLALDGQAGGVQQAQRDGGARLCRLPRHHRSSSFACHPALAGAW